MRTRKSFLIVAAIALSAVAPLSHAVPNYYSDTFQGLTFTFTQTDADTLDFSIIGTPSGDWTGVSYLSAFDLKDLGLDFSAAGGATGTATGSGISGSLLGANSQLSTSNQDCTKTVGEGGSICFNFNPDIALGSSLNLDYTLDFSDALSIASAGPHLQILFLDADGKKQGSLYSQNVGVPEPGSSSLFLTGLALLGLGMWTRRRIPAAAA